MICCCGCFYVGFLFCDCGCCFFVVGVIVVVVVVIVAGGSVAVASGLVSVLVCVVLLCAGV